MVKVLKAGAELTQYIRGRETAPPEAAKSARAIVDDVRARGDAALFEYAKKFDGEELNFDNILLDPSEIKAAYNRVDKKLISAFKAAASFSFSREKS